MSISEFDYYPALKERVRAMGYPDVYQEVRIHGNLETDIVGLKHFKNAPTRAIIVEVKANADIEKVLTQATLRRAYANRVYAAIVIGKDGRFIGPTIYNLARRFDDIKRSQIGVWVMDELRNETFEVFSSQMRKAVMLDRLLKAIPTAEPQKGRSE